MKNKYVIASFIAILMAGWVLSGQFAPSHADEADAAATALMAEEKANVTVVRGLVSKAESHNIELIVRGSTEVNRTVTVRSEIAGRIVGLPYPKGARVSEGNVLCRLAIDTKDQNLVEARAQKTQAALEYKGLIDLSNKGLQSEIALVACGRCAPQ